MLTEQLRRSERNSFQLAAGSSSPPIWDWWRISVPWPDESRIHAGRSLDIRRAAATVWQATLTSGQSDQGLGVAWFGGHSLMDDARLSLPCSLTIHPHTQRRMGFLVNRFLARPSSVLLGYISCCRWFLSSSMNTGEVLWWVCLSVCL